MDLRKLKDQAARAIEKRSYRKAAELYLEVAAAEPENPDWRQRAGDAYRRAGDDACAKEQLTEAAEGYAAQGFLLKAIAVCKMVLQLDPRHTAIQSKLSELYARRDDGGGRTPSGKVKLVSGTEIVRTETGGLAVVSIGDRRPVASSQARPPAPAAAPVWQPFEPEPRPRLTPGSDPVKVVALDDRPRPRTIPPGAPMEVVPLREVLGGRRTRDFPAVAADAAAAADTPAVIDPTLDADSGAYEIILDEPAPSAAELATQSKNPGSLGALDFSDLAEEPSPALDRLPEIPLFSSLPVDSLRELIERVELRPCPAGQMVVRQGEMGGALFVIVRGQVQVILEPPAGAPARELATLGEGAFFGELALLTDFPRSATVRALEDTELLVIGREVISQLVADSPEILRTLLRFFRDRMLERLLSSARLFSSLPPDESRRVAELFVFLELEPRMRVLSEGKKAPGLFLLLCGEAQVSRNRRVLGRLQSGDLFGEMSLLTGSTAVADIDTVTKCWALELPRERFQEVMLTYPQLLEYVSELAAQRTLENLGAAGRVEFL